MPKLLAVVGTGRESGKTTTVEALLREFVARGYRTGTIKQIHEEAFSIDTPEKDTWRHAEAGAEVVVSAAPGEVALIKRLRGEDRLQVALRLLEPQGLDIVLVEGNPSIDFPRVLAAREIREAERILQKVRGIVMISTLEPEKFEGSRLPVFNPSRDAGAMADLILKALALGPTA
ncbi:MAG: molybdopterin-guanine dinucleotide biosynthesis protein B [Candidatus Hydrothermarchaeota archaeon]